MRAGANPACALHRHSGDCARRESARTAKLAEGRAPDGGSQAGIQFLALDSLALRARLRLASGEPVTFFACAKKANQRNTPPVARSPGILPSDFARVLRGSLDVRPCTFSERPHIVRALLRTDPAHPRRATGGPVSAASCRRSQDSRPKSVSAFVNAVLGCTAPWIPAPFAVPSIAGDGGKCPQGRAHDARASSDSTRTYCQTTQPAPRSTGTPRRA